MATSLASAQAFPSPRFLTAPPRLITWSLHLGLGAWLSQGSLLSCARGCRSVLSTSWLWAGVKLEYSKPTNYWNTCLFTVRTIPSQGLLTKPSVLFSRQLLQERRLQQARVSRVGVGSPFPFPALLCPLCLGTSSCMTFALPTGPWNICLNEFWFRQRPLSLSIPLPVPSTVLHIVGTPQIAYKLNL